METSDIIFIVLTCICLLIYWVCSYEIDEFDEKGCDVVLKSILMNDVTHIVEKEYCDYKKIVFYRANNLLYNHIEFQIGHSFWGGRMKIKVIVTHLDWENVDGRNYGVCKTMTFKDEKDVNELLEMIEDAKDKHYKWW